MLNNRYLFPWITGFLMAGILVIPGCYALLTYWLAIYGLMHFKSFFKEIGCASLVIGGGPIWIGLIAYLFIGIGLGVWHGYRIAYFEAYLPMLLAPFIVNAVAVARPPLVMLWMASATAAILAGLMACYQSLYLQSGRAIGAMNNQIMFGDLSVVLAMFCAFGCIFGCAGRHRLWQKFYLSLGVTMGLLASLLSGTKGGWMSVLMVSLLLISVALSHWHWSKRLFVAVASFAAFAVLAWLVPAELVRDRISGGFNAAHIWFVSGQITDGSVSIRLEMWRQALNMIAEEPWTGWNSLGAQSELAKRLNSLGAGNHWTQVENDFLQIGIVHGIPGIISYFIFCMGLILGFFRIQVRKPNPPREVIVLTTLGVLMTVVMIEFGFSVIVLGRNAFRHTWIVWSMLLLGYLISSQYFKCTWRNRPWN